MSRIGKKPISIPAGVEIKLQNNHLETKGPKGTLSLDINPKVKAELKEKEILVSPASSSKETSAIWGLTRALMNNMIIGVTDGYKKQLELQGVGFRMAIAGKQLKMELGFSHSVLVDIPEGIEVKIEEGNNLSISGIDKHLVGQFTANIRRLKPVEPYKGKGFRYVGEQVRRKAGKKAATAK